MSSSEKQSDSINEHDLPIQDKHTQLILSRQLDGLPSLSPKNGTVFAYATRFDIILIAISTLAAIIAGALNPLLAVIYSRLVSSFQSFEIGQDGSSALSHNVSKFSLYYVYLAIGEFVLIYITTVGFYYSGERITRNLRRAYLGAIIRQNIAFFDTLSPGEITTRITSDMNVIQEGITSKISLFLTALATFLSAIIISFVEYCLVYPSRQSVEVLRQVNLRFPANKTTALVGASGCGKSSIIGLLERFYEPTRGHITLDGQDIASLNLHWLRQQMSYVVQEPILFNRNILENILLGLNDTPKSRSVTKEEALELAYTAAKTANAHDFIMALPQGYQTEVGAKGLQLSGGQRQRICIARAFISNPKILLLDEATSALDVKSQRAVQQALEAASQGRTTIVIAHRLSTIRNADNIIVMSHGSVVEQGRHNELMDHDGVYARLVKTQQIGVAIGEETKDSQKIHAVQEVRLESIKPEKSGFIEVNERPDSDGGPNESHPPGDSTTKPSFGNYLQVVSKLNRAEAPIIFAGILLCILAGLIIPVQAIFFAESLTAVSLSSSEYGKLRHDVNFWCLVFLMIAIVTFLAWVGQGVCFSYSTERLTHKARSQTFRSLLRQNVGFFDQKEHSAGALTALLATAATDLTGLSGPIIGAPLTFIATLITGVIISVAIGWKLGLVCTATLPIVTGCGYIRLRMLALFDSKVRKTHEEAATYASEIVTAIRSVAFLTLEDHVLQEYSEILDRQAAKSLKSILQASTLYAAPQSFTFFCAGLAFWYGGTLIAAHEYTSLQFYICFACLISGAQIAGAIFSYAPDMSKALHAAHDLKILFDRVPAIDTHSTTGTPIPQTTGHIHIKNASFRYPTRPERLVLDNFTMQIHPGQYVALVGPSGSGKSTLIQLLERFFDPIEGAIFLDGQDISHLNINNYRNLVSLVSQDPTLYQGSIRENLLLGIERIVHDDEIMSVCKEANIHDFISSLPSSLSTQLGNGGTLLSTGQKQRLSIARALLRNPSILLLDEATSALDSESEKLVQEALDRAAKHRTTIAVAHRLSTIQHADVICVLDQGRIVDMGTHGELISRRGLYWDLVTMQSLDLEP
ncbi:multidrug resistance protein 3 [Aspergillus sclerotiicarbonarius CBS 121057]|uniref:Multidrug resistance protein 3 n=1 Tax=Aspergillus sclerotiicarbonarius (strain CBS 121057 / IBT 28362) TaxID=1448318 RepID=A0A319E3C2_ASPSB|nr:multidrug resistance protein 3 [Aspergillus sclerotiicarbonarius CBS 121057]